MEREWCGTRTATLSLSLSLSLSLDLLPEVLKRHSSCHHGGAVVCVCVCVKLRVVPGSLVAAEACPTRLSTPRRASDREKMRRETREEQEEGGRRKEEGGRRKEGISLSLSLYLSFAFSHALLRLLVALLLLEDDCEVMVARGRVVVVLSLR